MDHVAAEEGRHVDEDSLSSRVEAKRVVIEGVEEDMIFAKVPYGALQ
jgi:hypothetical protein